MGCRNPTRHLAAGHLNGHMITMRHCRIVIMWLFKWYNLKHWHHLNKFVSIIGHYFMTIEHPRCSKEYIGVLMQHRRNASGNMSFESSNQYNRYIRYVRHFGRLYRWCVSKYLDYNVFDLPSLTNDDPNGPKYFQHVYLLSHLCHIHPCSHINLIYRIIFHIYPI